jgi:hypothetical protein
MVAVVSFLLQYTSLIVMILDTAIYSTTYKDHNQSPPFLAAYGRDPDPIEFYTMGMQVSAETRIWSKSFPYLVYDPCQAGPPIDRDTRGSF